MKKQLMWLAGRWKPLVAGVVFACILSVVLGFQIGLLTHGYSDPEQQYLTSVRSGQELLRHPVFLPHKLPTYILFKLHVSRIGIYRLVSAAFTAIMVVCNFFVLKRWYGLRTAILGSWLLLTAAWTLHIGRLAIPEATYMLIVPFLAVVVWLYSIKSPSIAMLMLTAVTAGSLYIPGFIWLIIALITWQRRSIGQAITKMNWVAGAACFFILLIALVPLILGSFYSPRNLLLAAGLPLHLPGLRQIADAAIRIPLQLFIQGPNDPVRWLGRLPLLNAFSITMLILGTYSLRYHLKRMRTKLLGGSAVILGLLIIFGGVALTPLLPLIYLLVAAGIAFMLQQWFAVFPRNPIARLIATSLMSISILLVSFYNINHYFIAWPQTPATRQVFRHTLVD